MAQDQLGPRLVSVVACGSSELPRLELPRLRCGVDIGGTFTDVVIVEEATGRLHIHKLLTTPDDPSHAAIEGIAALLRRQGLPPEAVTTVIHGTTLVTNTLIERKGARTGLVTTRGFRDILEIGREKRYDIYDIFLEMPKPPLAPRRLRRSEGQPSGAPWRQSAPGSRRRRRSRPSRSPARVRGARSPSCAGTPGPPQSRW